MVAVVSRFKDVKRGKIHSSIMDVLKDAGRKTQTILLEMFSQFSLNNG